MKRLEIILERTESSVLVICKSATFFIVCMCLFVFADIVGSFVFNLPIEGAVDISAYVMPLVVFLPLGYTQLTGTHPRVEFLFSRFSPRVLTALNIIALLLSIGFFIMMSREVGQVAYDDWINKVSHPQTIFTLPAWIPSFLAFVGFVLLVIALITQLLRNIIGSTRGEVVGLKTRT